MTVSCVLRSYEKGEIDLNLFKTSHNQTECCSEEYEGKTHKQNGYLEFKLERPSFEGVMFLQRSVLWMHSVSMYCHLFGKYLETLKWARQEDTGKTRRHW